MHAITLDLEREKDVKRPSRQDAKVIAQNRKSALQNDSAALSHGAHELVDHDRLLRAHFWE